MIDISINHGLLPAIIFGSISMDIAFESNRNALFSRINNTSKFERSLIGTLLMFIHIPIYIWMIVIIAGFDGWLQALLVSLLIGPICAGLIIKLLKSLGVYQGILFALTPITLTGTTYILATVS